MPFSPVLIAAAAKLDLSAVRDHLEKAGIIHPLLKFSDGEELVSYLQLASVAGPDHTPLRPGLLLLDLELPKSHGFETVRWIRQQRPLKDLPIVLLLENVEPKDVKRAAALGVTRIVTKYPAPRALADIMINAAHMN
jgi:CheY-like chemotaxis protein